MARGVTLVIFKPSASVSTTPPPEDRTFAFSVLPRRPLARARELLEGHPGSAYLRLARRAVPRAARRAAQRARSPEWGVDPSAGPRGPGRLPPAALPAHGGGTLAQDGWGPFEEKALALASLHPHGAGDEDV